MIEVAHSESPKIQSSLTGGQFSPSVHEGHRLHEQLPKPLFLSLSSQCKKENGKFKVVRPRSGMHHFHLYYICKTQFNVKKRYRMLSGCILGIRNFTNLVNRSSIFFAILAKHSFHCTKLPHKLIYIHFPH